MKVGINGFYDWWTNTVHGNYIENDDFDLVVDRFDKLNTSANA